MSAHVRAEALRRLREGDVLAARRLLLGLLANDPDDALAWRWYGETLPLASIHRRQGVRRMLGLLACLLAVIGAVLAVNPPLRALQRQYAGQTEAYQALQARYVELNAQQTRIAQEGERARRTNELITESYNALLQKQWLLQGDLDALSQRLAQLQADYAARRQEMDALQASFSQLEAQKAGMEQEYASLSASMEVLLQDKARVQAEYDALTVAYEEFRQQAISPPFIYIHDRMVDLAFRKTDGSLRKWNIPFEELDNAITQGHAMRDGSLISKIPQVTLKKGEETVSRCDDFRAFVTPAPFRQVMQTLYDEAPSADAFLYEVWMIVAQLTSYSEEIEETPRYPLETLLAGGGDCEDTAILLASMVKAAPADWEVSLVYMNGDNPYESVEPNHVIVSVDTGEGVYQIETTSDSDMLPYTQEVAGWYLGVE